ncbi:MAG: hypothetical protein JNM17_02465 [Archangium sp.]|nr:hypothetical protein [Archangium sp.]
MFSGLLLLHSWLRWLVLIVALVTLIRTSANRNTKAPWAKLDDQFSLALVGLADLQLALGLVFWMGLSPTTQVAFAQGLFSQTTLTFFALVHPIAMIAAIAWLHVGRVRLKKSPDSPERHGLWRRTTLTFIAIIVLAIPWPSLVWARPLFRIP